MAYKYIIASVCVCILSILGAGKYLKSQDQINLNETNTEDSFDLTGVWFHYQSANLFILAADGTYLYGPYVKIISKDAIVGIWEIQQYNHLKTFHIIDITCMTLEGIYRITVYDSVDAFVLDDIDDKCWTRKLLLRDGIFLRLTDEEFDKIRNYYDKPTDLIPNSNNSLNEIQFNKSRK